MTTDLSETEKPRRQYTGRQVFPIVAALNLNDEAVSRGTDALNAFDVIVLGREAEAFFDHNTESLLTDFVSKRGGSLIFARGKPRSRQDCAASSMASVIFSAVSFSGTDLIEM